MRNFPRSIRQCIVLSVLDHGEPGSVARVLDYSYVGSRGPALPEGTALPRVFLIDDVWYMEFGHHLVYRDRIGRLSTISADFTPSSDRDESGNIVYDMSVRNSKANTSLMRTYCRIAAFDGEDNERRNSQRWHLVERYHTAHLVSLQDLFFALTYIGEIQLLQRAWDADWNAWQDVLEDEATRLEVEVDRREGDALSAAANAAAIEAVSFFRIRGELPARLKEPNLRAHGDAAIGMLWRARECAHTW